MSAGGDVPNNDVGTQDDADHPIAPRLSHAKSYGRGFWVKLVLMAIVDAVGVYALFLAINAEHTVFIVSVIAGLVVINLVYFLPMQRLVPLKYLLPGLLFLLVYQIFVIGYTGYTAFTNYGDGHNSDKADAVAAILSMNDRKVAGTQPYKITVVEQGGTLGLAFVDKTGTAQVGLDTKVFEPEPDATIADGRVTAVPNMQVLSFGQITQQAQAVTKMRVGLSDDPNAGRLRTFDGSTGYVYQSTLVYDASAGTLKDTKTGTIYAPNKEGSFVSTTGENADLAKGWPGWRAGVGWSNFTKIFAGGSISGEVFPVLLWTIAFAFISVASTFLLGVFLALTFNEPRMRGRRIYRSLLILPYAFPGFLSALVWAGMLNTDFGFINQALFGGASIPWLTSPWLARLSVLGVNLWLGFPYMFLIATGALQSIDSSLYESARVDGASARQIFSNITFPMLMLATAPLLISSFAFNFNNFSLIYLLTNGGPAQVPPSPTGVGATDILITYTYKIAGLNGGVSQYGLASALSIMIFILVAAISVVSFRQTRKLEEMN